MEYEQGRLFLKCILPENEPNPLSCSDQSKGVAKPLAEEVFDSNEIIALPSPENVCIKERDIVKLLKNRQSRRKFNESTISTDEISFLLWSMQGTRLEKNGVVFKTVPSAGARQPFDLYFYSDNMENMPSGLYRYIASNHSALPITIDDERKEKLQNLLGQWFKCGIAVFIVANPYRCEWRYVNYAHKFCALDAGHIGQNGYLAAEALGLGCCAIGWYQQENIDSLLGLDGVEKFTCYVEVFGRY